MCTQFQTRVLYRGLKTVDEELREAVGGGEPDAIFPRGLRLVAGAPHLEPMYDLPTYMTASSDFWGVWLAIERAAVAPNHSLRLT